MVGRVGIPGGRVWPVWPARVGVLDIPGQLCVLFESAVLIVLVLLVVFVVAMMFVFEGVVRFESAGFGSVVVVVVFGPF